MKLDGLDCPKHKNPLGQKADCSRSELASKSPKSKKGIDFIEK